MIVVLVVTAIAFQMFGYYASYRLGKTMGMNAAFISVSKTLQEWKNGNISAKFDDYL